jgi:hypothetical protein
MTKQCLTAYYKSSIKFNVPKGIDLNDTDTYSYDVKWGTLYIHNLKTDEIIELEGTMYEPDYKYDDDTNIGEVDSDME